MTGPKLISFNQSDPATTNASTVDYILTFSETVTGVDAADFTLATSGLTGASIIGVTPVAGSNGTQYTVAVNAGTGDGTLTLDFDSAKVRDLAGNGLPGGSFRPATNYAAGSGPEFGPAIADLTGNGIPDLVVPDNYGRGFSVCLATATAHSRTRCSLILGTQASMTLPSVT